MDEKIDTDNIDNDRIYITNNAFYFIFDIYNNNGNKQQKL